MLTYQYMTNPKTVIESVPTHRYIVHFEPDTEDGGYTVTVPALPGCITQGRTLDESREHVKEAIQTYLESLAIDGLEPPPSDAPAPNTKLEEVAEVTMP